MAITAFPSASPTINAATEILGMQRLVSLAFAGRDLTPILHELLARAEANPHDAVSLHDIATILHASQKPEPGLLMLNTAVAMQKNFCIVHGDGSGPRLLALVTGGDFMANIPIDFLLNHSNSVLWLHYVDAETTSLNNLPEHDVAIMAIGEAESHIPILARVELLLPSLKVPVLNRATQMIASLTRDHVSDLLGGVPSILAPRSVRVERATLVALATGQAQASETGLNFGFPMVVRPVGTHAGGGLERVNGAAELATYLAREVAGSFYLAPFIDYRGADGLYNKQRVVFIKGRPFASHMALSDHWIVHYLSAGMIENPGKRAIEAKWMETFDEDFAQRHAAAFAALNQIIGLDYFGIDCAEMPDGRLLVFEVDVAMIVHDMDDGTLFPYKKAAMRKLFDAFVAMAMQPPQEARANAA